MTDEQLAVVVERLVALENKLELIYESMENERRRKIKDDWDYATRPMIPR